MYLHQAPRFPRGERHGQHPVPCKALVCLMDLLSQKEMRELPLRSGPAGETGRGAGVYGYICMGTLETGCFLWSYFPLGCPGDSRSRDGFWPRSDAGTCGWRVRSEQEGRMLKPVWELVWLHGSEGYRAAGRGNTLQHQH